MASSRTNARSASAATRKARQRRIQTKRNKGSRLGITSIACVVIVFGAVMFLRTKEAEAEINNLEQKKQALEMELKEEQLRTKELEERKIYVQTKLYVEEMAKKLGLVYPDEIIYKPSN